MTSTHTSASRPGALSGLRSWWRHGPVREYRLALVLGLLTLGINATIFADPVDVPIAMLMVPLLIGSMLLGPRQLQWFVVFLQFMLMLALLPQEKITTRLVLA